MARHFPWIDLLVKTGERARIRSRNDKDLTHVVQYRQRRHLPTTTA